MATPLDPEFAEKGIHEVDDPAEKQALMDLARPFLPWRPLGVNASYPDLDLDAVRARGWVTGIKVWVDALGVDDDARCRALALVSKRTELIAVLPPAGEST